LHQSIACRQHSPALAAGIAVVDKARLEHLLLTRHEHVVDDSIAEVRCKYFARLDAIGHEANGSAGSVRMLAQLLLE